MNLQIAANRLTAIAKKEASEEGGSGVSVTIAAISAADAMLKDDITANKVSRSQPTNHPHQSHCDCARLLSHLEMLPSAFS